MKILHFADLHLGVESYGRIDPTSGLSTRLLDFLGALDYLVDYALDNKVDLVLFCGDAYKSRDPGQTQQREFAKRIHRLSDNGIPLFLLVGNHDIPNTFGGATTPEIFDTLAIDKVYVANRPQLYCIPTTSGTLQIVSLPWLRRSTLLTREETKQLTFKQINQKLEQLLTKAIDTYIPQLDPNLPSILAAHVWVSGAQAGSERAITIGQEPTLLLGNIANPTFDYIALGHIHKHQVMQSEPPVVYSGSLAHLNFGEANDDKGFYIVEIKMDNSTAKRLLSFDFHPVPDRTFLTINVDIAPQDTDPTSSVLSAITAHKQIITGAIVRLQINLPASIEHQLKDDEIKSALKDSSYLTINKEIKRETRLRLGNLGEKDLTPVETLRKYLETRKDLSPDRIKTLLRYGEELIQQH